MRKVFSLATALIVLLVGLVLLGWWGSKLSYATVSNHLNELAQDGLVETYTEAFHQRIRSNLRSMAGSALVGLLLFLFLRSRFARGKQGMRLPAAQGSFRADLAQAWKDLWRRTSASHKQFVLLLILVGVALRAILLFQPITYDEAFTFTYYASRPIHVIVSDYSYPNNHILHSMLVKCSTLILGIGKVSLRLPAFIAGVAVMPLFYFFVRAMFNRYIALMTLAMVAASGPLLEYSANARGYSLTWLFFTMALLLGRHFLKTNVLVSAMLIGVVCALGMWAVPTMLYAVVMIYAWLLMSLVAMYDTSLRERIWNWVISLGAFVLLTTLLYLPVILVHGFDQLLHHSTLPERNWKAFTIEHQDRALDLWAHVVDSSSFWLALLGFMGLVHATFISSKFRFLVAGMLLGAVPLVLMQAVVAPPRAWLYTLLIFHLSSGIALFYLLKFVQDKLIPGLGKRSRSVAACLVLLVVFGWPGLQISKLRMAGMPEAHWCAGLVQKNMQPGDKLYTDYPWNAPIEFHLMALGMDRNVLYGPPTPGSRVFVAVGPDYEQTLESVLAHQALAVNAFPPFQLIQDRPRLKIFAAP